jgi:hypothetical protein
MYASYFVLFCLFFRESYLKKKTEKSKAVTKEATESDEKHTNGVITNGDAVNGVVANGDSSHEYNLRKRNTVVEE